MIADNENAAKGNEIRELPLRLIIKHKIKDTSKSKYGTYLRYKRVSKFENEAKVKHRIIHFIKNYEYTSINVKCNIV